MRTLAFTLVFVAAIAFGVQPPAGPAKPKFEKDVKPVLKKLCLKCHTGEYAADKVDLAKIATEADAKKHLKVLKKSLAEMKKKAMPPKGNTQPSAAELKAFETWVKAQK